MLTEGGTAMPIFHDPPRAGPRRISSRGATSDPLCHEHGRAPMTEDQPTVFVIDDDVSVRDAIKGVVRSVGLRAETFASTQDFLRKWQPDRPSCLVLDVRLPGLSGLDFQQELTRANIGIPIIFLTG